MTHKMNDSKYTIDTLIEALFVAVQSESQFATNDAIKAIQLRDKILVEALKEICSNDPNRLSNMSLLAEEALKQLGEIE